MWEATWVPIGVNRHADGKLGGEYNAMSGFVLLLTTTY